MSSYFLKCRQNTESINPRVLRNKNDKTMIISMCSVQCAEVKSQDLLIIKSEKKH